jgi:hypothetical protein
MSPGALFSFENRANADFDVVVVPLIGINTMVILFELALG